MKLLTYEAHNVLGVKDIKFDLAGRHLFLVGGANGQGKSSALTGLLCALAGKSGMEDYPEIVLRKGQKNGSGRGAACAVSRRCVASTPTTKTKMRKSTTLESWCTEPRH